MRLYEVVYIFDASLDEAAVEKKLQGLHKKVSGKNKGEVRAVDHWGVRQLAYPIGPTRTGYYVVAHVETEPELLPEFERVLRLDDSVIRYLVVLNEGEPTTGMSILADRPESADGEGGRPEEEDDEDEDEDEDEDDEDDDAPPEFSGGMGRRRRVEGPAIQLLNYKDVSTLSRFLTEQGKILPRRTTKVTASFQRQLSRAVKRARYLSLIPYVRDHEV